MKQLNWLLMAFMLWATQAVAAPVNGTAALVDAARGAVPIDQPTRPPLLGNAVNDDVRRARNYDMQPPTIPHRVDGYQVDKNFNKCLDCHARDKTELSRAIPVSVTHYIDRNGRVLKQISTRRYFCQQCHVAQNAATPLVRNTFENLESVSARAAATAPANPRPQPRKAKP